MSDDQIDTSDIPELPPAAWRMPDAVRGRFYRPVKQAVSMRLDADVIVWLKKPGKDTRPAPTASCASACWMRSGGREESGSEVPTSGVRTGVRPVCPRFSSLLFRRRRDHRPGPYDAYREAWYLLRPK